MNKVSLQAYIERKLKVHLEDYVKRGRGRTQSSVVEAALIAYFEDATDTDALYRRLDRQSRLMGKISRDHDVLNEAFAVFVKLWFAHTPRVPASDRDDAQRFAAKRFEQYVEHVGREFAAGHRFVDDLVTDLPPVGESEPAEGERAVYNG